MFLVLQDVLELLEKRVKSRFSHRFLHLLPTHEFDNYLEVCQDVLSLPANFGPGKMVKEWNKHVEVFKSTSALFTPSPELLISLEIALIMKNYLFCRLSYRIHL